MGKFIRRSAYILAILILAGSAGVTYFAFQERDIPQEPPFAVERGESLSGIAERLEDAGIIPYDIVFVVAAKVTDKARTLKSGVYRFPLRANTMQIIEILHEGSHQVEKWVSIPEGSSTKAIGAILQSKVGTDATKFYQLTRDKEFIRSLGLNVRSLEGYLLPETYRFLPDTPPEKAVTVLHEHLMDIIDEHRGRLDSLPWSLHEILTMASIVEGEVQIDEERPIVAGVYYNRLRIGMLLQADPTIQYIIKDGPRRILYRDLKIDSPYNTYKYAGLPPGPINNPGKASILAALYPAKHSYLYFVADGKGGHVFTSNQRDHQRAVREYRRIQRQRRSR